MKEAKALAKLEAAKLAQEVVIDEITIEDSTNDTTPIATPVPPPVDDTPKKLTEIKEPSDVQMVETDVKLTQISEELLKEPQPPPVAVYEEETRMSADNSRAQTPARQVVIPPQLEGPEESQSSVQSSATTESNKNKKGRLEVCDPDSAVTGVEQIVEYSWGGGGTYMLQEQIAQFLGVKSFKRKYPGLTRRPVEMQERDYIREKGLVSESMCDMGLTAVPSSEILDIMYTDFQEKYEEYRKCMRDKQSKEISNKQKAISLATSQEKNKIDFKERAIRSAANWNVNFNKARKESRRCCMDLQTFTINFPLGRTQPKVPQKNPVGHYPIALVPGQFTDYYKPYTSNELHYLPLNTVRYGPVMPNQHCADGGQSDGSQSDSDSSSGSDSDSSDDSMSTIEDTPSTTFGKPGMNLSLSTPKAKVH